MRVSGDYVYLLSDFNASIVNGRDAIGEYVPSVQGKLVEDSNICMPQYIRGDTYTVVSSFSLKNPEEKSGQQSNLWMFRAGICQQRTIFMYVNRIIIPMTLM